MLVKNVEKKDSKTASFQVEVDAKEFDAAVDQAFKKNKSGISIPGFRKGKAPRAVVEGMYGHDVFYQDAIDELVAPAYEHGYDNCGLKIIGKPAVSNMDLSDDKVLTLTFDVELYPEVTLGEYKNLSAVKETYIITEEDVDGQIDGVRKRNGRVIDLEREAQMGDTADIDFEGTLDGVPFDGGKAEGYELELGSNTFVPGFEEQIVGMNVGEEKDIDITFPEDYHKDLAGKAVVFHVKVNKLTMNIIPEQDDEFAKDVSEFDTLEALKADIRAKALEKAQKQLDSDFENAAVEKAAENTTVDMPNALVEKELDVQMERFGYQLQMSGYSMEQYAKMMGGDVNTMRNAFRPTAEKQAKISVTLEKIAEVENLTVTEQDIEEEFESMAKQYEMEVSKVKELVPVEELTESLKTRKAVKLIVDSAVAVAPKAEEKTEE